MTRRIKGIAISFTSLSLAIVLFFFYAISGNLAEGEYTELIDYPEKFQSADSSLRVMTYNLGYLSGMTNNQSIKRERSFFAENLGKAKKLVQELDVDVIGLQEVDVGSSRSFYANQLDSLARAGSYVAGYKSINWDKNYVPFPYWPPSNHFGKMLSGQAILSKHAVGERSTHVLTPHLNAPAYYLAFYLDRLLQMVEIDFFDTKLRIINVHLEAFDRPTRLQQIKDVKAEYEKYAANQPVLLIGDFNSEVSGFSEDKDAIEVLMDFPWITSAIPFNQVTYNKTFPSKDPETMIDYIFYNRNFLKCFSARVVKEAGQISDHLPVVAEFRLITQK